MMRFQTLDILRGLAVVWVFLVLIPFFSSIRDSDFAVPVSTKDGDRR